VYAVGLSFSSLPPAGFSFDGSSGTGPDADVASRDISVTFRLSAASVCASGQESASDWGVFWFNDGRGALQPPSSSEYTDDEAV